MVSGAAGWAAAEGGQVSAKQHSAAEGATCMRGRNDFCDMGLVGFTWDKLGGISVIELKKICKGLGDLFMRDERD